MNKVNDDYKFLKRNILKYYLSQFLFGIQFTAPIFILFLLANDLTLTEIAILGSLQAILIGFFEIPSGVLADFFGRKRVLIFAGFMALFGATVYSISHSFYTFLIADVFYALALSFKSGSDVSWIYDTLKNLKLENKFKRIKGKGDLINAVALFLSQGSITIFLVKDYRTYFILMIPITLLIVITIFSYREPAIHLTKDIKIKREFKTHLINSFKIIKNNHFLSYIFLFLILESIIGSAYYFLLLQPYLEIIKYPLTLFGLLWAVTGLLTGIGSYFSDPIESIVGKRFIIYTAPIIIFLPILFLGLTHSIIPALCLILFAQFTIGIYYVVFEDYINKEISSDKRATILSSKNFFRYIAWGALGPLIGYIADKFSINYTFLILGVSGLVISYLTILIFRPFYHPHST